MIRVLLVDDAEDIRLLLRIILEGDGRFEIVGEGRDGAEGLELVDATDPDVVVLDMAMPKLDGLQVLAEMKARGHAARVLVLSGFDRGVEERARELGAHDYLCKGTSLLTEVAPRLAVLFEEPTNQDSGAPRPVESRPEAGAQEVVSAKVEALGMGSGALLSLA